MWRTKMFSVPGVVALVTVFAVVVGSGLTFIVYQISTFDRAAAGVASEPLQPPEGVHEEGILVGTPGEKTLTISTDPRCPYCEELIDDHRDELTAMADDDEWEVRLEVVSIFEDSQPSDTVALTLLELSESGADEVLALYQELSSRAEDLRDAGRGEYFDTEASGSVSLVSRSNAEAERVSWLDAVSDRNRREVGTVPAARIDGEYISTDELEPLFSEY